MTSFKAQQTYRRAFLTGAGVVAMMTTAPVMAQAPSTRPTAAPNAVSNEDDTSSLDIVVTGQKTGGQSLLKVPLTMSAMDSKALESARVQNLADISKLIPSITLVESFGRAANYLSIRGVSGSENGTPTVQIFVDGFTTGTTRGQVNSGLFELERVEVLEGPQATLYGANAIGGVINYITKKPGNTLEASLRLLYGEYNDASVIGNVSGPLLKDKIYVGIAASYHHRDGYLDNIATGDRNFNKQDDVSTRAALRGEFGDTTVDLSASYARTRDGCSDCYYIPRDYDLNAVYLTPAPPFNTSLRDGLVNLQSYDRTVDQAGPSYLRINSTTEVMNITHDLGDIKIASITGYGRTKTEMAFDLSRAATRNPNPAFAAVAFNNLTSRSFSQELRVFGGRPDTFNWVVGAYFLDLREDNDVFLGVTSPVNIIDTVNTNKNIALFANAAIPIGTHFTLSGGLRYDYQKVGGSNPLLNLNKTTTSKVFLPRGTIQYRFNPDLMLYVTVSKGYKTGGVNVQSPDPVAPNTFGPEFIWNYEAGLKGKLLDGRATFSLSAFRMDWTDRQVQLLDSSGIFAYQANLGKSKITGVELTAGLNVGSGFVVNGAVTYLDGEITKYLDLSGTSTFYGINPDLAGNRLPNTPRLKGSLSPEFTTPIGSGSYSLKARADVSYSGSFYFDAQNLLRQNRYALVNLYLGMESENFEVGVFANNVFDRAYHSGATLTTIGPLLGTGTPRIVGVRARLKY